MNCQASVTEQLQKLIDLAHKNGLYDAADWVITAMDEKLSHYVDSDSRCVNCDKVISVEGDEGYCLPCTPG